MVSKCNQEIVSSLDSWRESQTRSNHTQKSSSKRKSLAKMKRMMEKPPTSKMMMTKMKITITKKLKDEARLTTQKERILR